MSLRNSILADYFYRILERTQPPKKEHSRLSPNQVTILGALLAMGVPFGFYVHPFWGLLFMMLSGFADAMDGFVAKNQGTRSDFGAFLDSSLDRMSDFFFICGFWIFFWESRWLILASGLVFLSFLFTFMISYTKARVEGLGGTCETGLMERGVRTLYLITWAFLLCILPNIQETILWLGLILFCVLTLFTLVQRLFHIRSEFKT